METNEIKKEWTEQVVYVPCSGHDIWCKLYLPLMEEGETLPLVILSHGMDDNYLSCEPYAEKFAARGVAACCLEFYGGGGSMTGGTTSEMSIMTETEELKTVLEAAKGWEFADPERIVLFGESQGAIVSAFTASEKPEDVHGLVLCYPAYVIFDDAHRQYRAMEDIPEHYKYRWLDAGHLFFYDIWDIDPYKKSSLYTKRTLILHGNADYTVPISYSEKAADVFADNDFYVINGAKHGFRGKTFDKAMEYIIEYFANIGVL